jgi:hypothetical protein
MTSWHLTSASLARSQARQMQQPMMQRPQQQQYQIVNIPQSQMQRFE